MSIELSRVHALRQGWVSALAVGPLHKAGADYLKSTAGEVWISRERLLHIDNQHDGLSDFEIISMSFGLMNGLFVADEKRPNCLIISYVLPNQSRRYKIAIKSAAQGRELWVSTFHRTRPRQTRTLLTRGRVIKPHS